MKVSIDGLRGSAMSELKRLESELEHIKDQVDEDDYHELADKFDDFAQWVNILMCVHDDKYEDDFNDLSANRCEYFGIN